MFLVVFGLRLFVPLLILRFPLPAIVAALVLDAADQSIFEALTDIDLTDLVGGVKLDDKENVLVSVLLDLSQTASLEASIDVADRVLGGRKKGGKVHKKHVEAAAFAVLKSPDIPSILVETAYISNPAEEKKLRDANHRRKLAMAIRNGLKGYFMEHAPEGTILASRKHIITRGDTLSLIAQHYRVSLNSLKSVNNLQSDRIRVGQVLTIPALVN